ncbi:MAG TPA: tRNA preQ1(34) S-adenosylmethionine ribosyltransferase-isomerase QueA, partial [Phototrophicaceae bacterium]|nr:tRNA preQ1(34) S-adenosylmethionine ribosyltransferase-isomerase QueA [Phototrophicaceae bacterium]
MQLIDFDYDLPEHFIAQTPAEPRDSSKLMVLDRQTHTIEHRIFRDVLDYLDPGDILVMNTTRVLPARLPAVKVTGGAAEVLLLRQITPTRWRALVGGRNLHHGASLTFPNSDLTATIAANLDGSEREVEFNQPLSSALLQQIGEMPLPPYIHERLTDTERYQTIYSREEGSAAAPTAGLHFTPDLLLKARDKGVLLANCLLHIGLDTFLPVREAEIEHHKIHSERAILTAENAKIINEAKLAGKRIIAVGTTSARTLETAGILSAGGDPADPATIGDLCAWRPVIAFDRDTNLFIYPGYRWRIVDAMITNFHLPKSTLIMMMSSFAGRDYILQAYETAKQHN